MSSPGLFKKPHVVAPASPTATALAGKSALAVQGASASAITPEASRFSAVQNYDAPTSSRRPKPRLTTNALKLALTVNPDKVVRILAKAISGARTSGSIRAAVQRVDDLGLDRMIVAAVGNKLAAHRLCVDMDLAERIRKGKPTVTIQGLLHLDGDWDLRGVEGKTLPWVQSVGGWLKLTDTKDVTLPALRNPVCIAYGGAKNVSIPGVQRSDGQPVII